MYLQLFLHLAIVGEIEILKAQNKLNIIFYSNYFLLEAYINLFEQIMKYNSFMSKNELKPLY